MGPPAAKRFPALGPTHTAQRLYYATSGFFLPGRAAPLPAPWTVTLDVSRVEQRKFEAFRAHTTQLPLMERFQSSIEKRAGKEFYTLAATPHPQPAAHATNLFAGLRVAVRSIRLTGRNLRRSNPPPQTLTPSDQRRTTLNLQSCHSERSEESLHFALKLSVLLGCHSERVFRARRTRRTPSNPDTRTFLPQTSALARSYLSFRSAAEESASALRHQIQLSPAD